MMEGILRSIRAQTKVAKEKRMNLEIELADDRYFPSFKREKGAKGKNVSRRILRAGGKDGTEVVPERVVWRVGKYVRGEVVHSYEVKDIVSPDKTDQYIIVAPTQKDAKEYAKKRHEARVKAFKGLARMALSLAMKSVYSKSSANDKVSTLAKDVATRNTQVQVSSTGFNSGTVDITVHDNLEYAIPAMENGESSVQEAIALAMKKTIGYIEQKVKKTGGSIDQSLKTTLDEMIRANE